MTTMALRFGSYIVDLDARRLCRGSDQVHLSPKAFDTLKMLIERRPNALSKAEILERVWPNVFVSEASLARVVNEIRTALGDASRDGRVIRTVHSYGYAFAAAVENDSAGSDPVSTVALSACLLVSATRTVILRQGEQFAGRDPVSDIWIDSPKISWRHARLLARHTCATIEDLGSKNGTFVRNVRIDGPTVLQHGDEVRFGRSTFVFRVEDARQVTETDVESGIHGGSRSEYTDRK